MEEIIGILAGFICFWEGFVRVQGAKMHGRRGGSGGLENPKRRREGKGLMFAGAALFTLASLSALAQLFLN